MSLLNRFKISRSLRWILAVGGMAVGAVLFFINYRFNLVVGTGPAGPPVAAKPFEKLWSERKVVLVGIGDSVTAGFGAPKGKGYVELLADNPPDEFDDMGGRSLRRVLPNLQIKNIAVSGSNSLQHVGYVKELETQPKDVFGIVVMTCGGNDLIHWYGRKPPLEGAMYGATLAQAQPWIANYKTRLDGLLTDIENKFPGGCLIFLADIYDPSDGVGDPETTWALPAWPDALPILAAYNQTIRDVAATHPSVRVVPMHDAFLGHGIHCRQWWRRHYCSNDPTYWYGKNLEDPNDRGYDALRRVFLNEIVKEEKRLRGP
ncbi:MAG: SGNH/GDSL hydrolase family protein [Pirellulaceae bacterium]|nr:SGNH/GDSL hydrolase family protein [Pirellulaceae bacterium]